MTDAIPSRAANWMWVPGDGKTHAGWEGCCNMGHVHRTRDIGSYCECGCQIMLRPESGFGSENHG